MKINWKCFIYQIKDNLSKSRKNPFIKYFRSSLWSKCWRLSVLRCYALSKGCFFISNQKSLVLICTKVWKEFINQIEIALKTKFGKFKPIPSKYFCTVHITSEEIKFYRCCFSVPTFLSDEKFSLLAFTWFSIFHVSIVRFCSLCLHNGTYSPISNFHPAATCNC